MRTFNLEHGDAPETARRAVAQCCAFAATGPDCADSAALLTSEVVTNAVRHGSGAVTLGIDCAEGSVRVEVGDAGRSRPRLAGGSDDAEHGRGMLIVDALASAWGVDDTATGKVVWFEVACPLQASSPGGDTK